MQLSHFAPMGSIVKMLLYALPTDSRGHLAAAGALRQAGVATNVLHSS